MPDARGRAPAGGTSHRVANARGGGNRKVATQTQWPVESDGRAVQRGEGSARGLQSDRGQGYGGSDPDRRAVSLESHRLRRDSSSTRYWRRPAPGGRSRFTRGPRSLRGGRAMG